MKNSKLMSPIAIAFSQIFFFWVLMQPPLYAINSIPMPNRADIIIINNTSQAQAVTCTFGNATKRVTVPAHDNSFSLTLSRNIFTMHRKSRVKCASGGTQAVSEAVRFREVRLRFVICRIPNGKVMAFHNPPRPLTSPDMSNYDKVLQRFGLERYRGETICRAPR